MIKIDKGSTLCYIGPTSNKMDSMKSHLANCACGACHNKRVANGTQEAYERELRAATDKVLKSVAVQVHPQTTINTLVSATKAMPGGETDLGFAKNLFQTVQGVKFDDKCPHGSPFYACMPCSH